MEPAFERIGAGDAALAVVAGDGVLVASARDALDLFLSAGVNALILRERQISPDFFRLATGLAGEVAQKCVNYGLRLGIVGDFDERRGRSLKAFIAESNRTGPIAFTATLEDAVARLSGG